MPRLILVCGLPGAGKTTLARRLADEVPAVRLSGDEWMVALGIGSGCGPLGEGPASFFDLRFCWLTGGS